MKKVTLLFPRNPSLKIKILSSLSPPPPSFWKFGWRPNQSAPSPSPLQQKGGAGGAHYDLAIYSQFATIFCQVVGRRLQAYFFFLKNQIFITKEYI